MNFKDPTPFIIILRIVAERSVLLFEPIDYWYRYHRNLITLNWRAQPKQHRKRLLVYTILPFSINHQRLNDEHLPFPPTGDGGC